MKLSKEEIKFIDTYLQNSKVVYIDVRLEMVDHIASAVEDKMEKENRSFYNAFKEYMAQNKRELLKKNEKRFFSWEGVLPFLRFLVQPVLLVFGVLWYFVLSWIGWVNYSSDVYSYFSLIFGLTAFTQTLYLPYFVKKRYYMLERSGQLLMFLYIFTPYFFILSLQSSLLLFTIYSYVLIGYFLYMIKQILVLNRHPLNYA